MPSLARPAILISSRYYLPGYLGGGPIQSIANLTKALADKYDFRIVCLDEDANGQRYPHIVRERWIASDHGSIYYVPRDRLGVSLWKNLLADREIRVLYTNSFFDLPFSILPLAVNAWLTRRTVPIVVAPRGEFSPGALALKGKKKRAYLRLARYTSIYDRVVWQACSELELREMERAIDTYLPRATGSRIVAQNISIAPQGDSTEPRSPKRPGTLRVVFLSRISRKKNLAFAVQVLRTIMGRIDFDIFGPIEDTQYWNECERLLRQLPANVKWRYCGTVGRADVLKTLAHYDVLLLPTLGENFGHVIYEALSAGVPVIISDKTPWADLQANEAGWALELDADLFRSAIERMVGLDGTSQQRMQEAARQYAIKTGQSAVGRDQFDTILRNLLDTKDFCNT
jgi:glycosyltransferase involved in cell wall biosynthesis